MRMDLGKAVQIIDMICEVVGIRAVERLSKVNRHTILDLLETVGRKCQNFLDTRIRNVSVESVQCDEVFGFVGLKEVNNRLNDPNLGTQYLFLGVDRKSKLILSRSEEHTSELQSQSNLVCRLLLEKKKNRLRTTPQHRPLGVEIP